MFCKIFLKMLNMFYEISRNIFLITYLDALGAHGSADLREAGVGYVGPHKPVAVEINLKTNIRF